MGSCIVLTRVNIKLILLLRTKMCYSVLSALLHNYYMYYIGIISLLLYHDVVSVYPNSGYNIEQRS